MFNNAITIRNFVIRYFKIEREKDYFGEHSTGWESLGPKVLLVTSRVQQLHAMCNNLSISIGYFHKYMKSNWKIFFITSDHVINLYNLHMTKPVISLHTFSLWWEFRPFSHLTNIHSWVLWVTCWSISRHLWVQRVTCIWVAKCISCHLTVVGLESVILCI